MRIAVTHIWVSFLASLPISLPASAQTYAPGIPEPSGCLRATAPALPADWPGVPSAGYYYVDNRSEHASDDDNPFGSKSRPRLTIPQGELAAGSYVALHGGPYTANKIVTVGLGTIEAPVWIRGADPGAPTTIRAKWYAAGRHLVLENLRFDQNHKALTVIGGTGICVRHNLFSGPRKSSGNSAVIFIGGRSAKEASTGTVVYKNVIRDFGDVNSQRENDYHGILVGGYATSTWILDNDISANGGDGVQVGNTKLRPRERPRMVYIARNRMEDNRENAVDIKRASDVIVSSNRIRRHRATSSSGGAGIIIHNDPEHIWIVNNDVSDSDIGIITTGSTDTWFVGNVIHDITHRNFDWDPNSGYASGAAMHFRGASSGGAIGNTVAYCDIGLQLTQGSPAGYAIHNNIFAYRRAAEGDDIRIASGRFTSALEISHNLFYGETSNFKITWAGHGYRTTENLQKNTGLFNHTLTSDPSFLDPERRNFTLRPDSPAFKSGTRTGVDERFRLRYEVDLLQEDYRSAIGAPPTS
jgi:Right handed beta helix region